MWLSASIPVPVSYYSNTHKPKNSLANTVKMPVYGNASNNQLFALWGLVTYTVFGAKPLSEQTLVSVFCQLKQPLMRFESKFNICRGRKWFWKCCLQNDGHLFSKDFLRSLLWKLIIWLIHISRQCFEKHWMLKDWLICMIKTKLQHPANDLYWYFTSTIYTIKFIRMLFFSSASVQVFI